MSLGGLQSRGRAARGCQQGPHVLWLCHFPWGLFQWHQTHRTWGTQQDTCTALGEPRVTCPGLPRSTPLTTLSLMGARYFPACFGWDSFVMLRDLVGLWEAVRMLRESRVCSSPASRLYSRAKQPW